MSLTFPDRPTSRQVRTSDHGGEIEWYVEQRGGGPDVVLIPSGEGDCGSFAQVAADLATDFRVTTFDTPGFSRSAVSADVEISMVALARQVTSLIDALGIEKAIFYGCSSAGLAVLDIVSSDHDLISQAIVHEAALPEEGQDSRLNALVEMDDAQVAATCANLFENVMNDDPVAWKALGPEFHGRLAANYITWVRRYVAGPSHPPVVPESLAGTPITWSIGSQFEVYYFFSNVQLAHRAGIDIGVLPCKHFPQVSIPQQLANHIRQAGSHS